MMPPWGWAPVAAAAAAVVVDDIGRALTGEYYASEGTRSIRKRAWRTCATDRRGDRIRIKTSDEQPVGLFVFVNGGNKKAPPTFKRWDQRAGSIQDSQLWAWGLGSRSGWQPLAPSLMPEICRRFYGALSLHTDIKGLFLLLPMSGKGAEVTGDTNEYIVHADPIITATRLRINVKEIRSQEKNLGLENSARYSPSAR
jgi:hypothetical protein